MKYLITTYDNFKDTTKLENYSKISLKELGKLCKKHKIDGYFGGDCSKSNPPHSELISTQNREYTIHLYFENLNEARIIELSLRHMVKYYNPFPDEINKNPLKTSTIKINQTTRHALKALKQKNENYSDLLSRLVFFYCSEND